MGCERKRAGAVRVSSDDDPRAKASNPGNEMNASGPGNLRIFRRGEDPAAPTGAPRSGVIALVIVVHSTRSS